MNEKYNTKQLDLIHKSLREILVLLRDNPNDDTNPSMWNQVYRIVNVAEVELDELKDEGGDKTDES